MNYDELQRRGREAGEAAKNETREALEKHGFSFEKLAKELKVLVFSNMKDYVTIDEQGAVRVKPIDQLGTKTKAIRKIKEKRRIISTKEDDAILEDTLEFELYNKLEAIEFAAQLMGMEQPKKLEHSGPDGQPLTFPPLHVEFGGPSGS